MPTRNCPKPNPVSHRRRVAAVLLFCLAATAATAAEHVQTTVREGTNIQVDVRADGQLVTDLVGGLWLIPADGGVAERLPNERHPARSPRFSPDGEAIAYVAEQGQHTELWIYELADRSTRPVAATLRTYAQPDWHPDGTKLVFAADADGHGFAIWELDIATGLSWRLTHGRGEATWPSWSGDGRDLLYVLREDETYRLMLRRRGRIDEVLLESGDPLSAPSFRPDKSLVTFIRHAPDALRIDMVILSTPRLVRTLLEDDDVFVGRVAWKDRERLTYTSGGRIRQRSFDAWQPSTVGFEARLQTPLSVAPGKALGRRLVNTADADSRALVVRAARLFDGVASEYREDVDILIRDGLIAGVEPSRPRQGQILVDLGDITVIPGLIDIYARLPQKLSDADGARLLSFGVTTLVANRSDAESIDARWAKAATPGPRLLRAATLDTGTANAASEAQSTPWLLLLNGDRSTGRSLRGATRAWQQAGIPVLAGNWQVGLGAGASLVLGGEALPVSPAGRRYADLAVSNGRSAVTIVSSLAHAGTPGVAELFERRQANGLQSVPARRLASRASLGNAHTELVLGSAANALPPGVAQHAELRALVAAGLSPFDALKAATVNAANALGLGLRAGRIAPGAAASLVLIAGDPLQSIEEAANVVGVVQNGRFMSAGRLIDSLEASPDEPDERTGESLSNSETSENLTKSAAVSPVVESSASR
ncbi:MAG: amidohydrolase family protein [Pseudomonadota bacterium]